MDAGPAVRHSPEGALLDVDVQPGAKRAAFPSGWNGWRKRVEAKVSAPPEDGRANAELVAAASAFFGVPVEVASGATSRRKTLLLVGLGREAALAKLARAKP
ncbi:MAG: DUF167 domain-containing protein [Thermoplasmatota archaeon]